MTEWNEPLAKLALAGWKLAPQLCSQDHACADYHRAWGLIRWLVGNGRLPAGGSFFARELRHDLSQNKKRILISGGADAGLTSLILQICRAQGIEPEIVFSDRCATACELNRMLASEAQAHIEVIECDIVDLDREPVDFVIAHSFLIFFEGEKRQSVLQAWYRLCRDGGRILMSNVLKASEDDWAVQKDPAAIQSNLIAFEENARRAGLDDSTVHEMVEAAVRFWQFSPGRPPGLTENNLREGLYRSGFSDVRIEYAADGAFKGPVAVIRDQASVKKRAEITAVKRVS